MEEEKEMIHRPYKLMEGDSVYVRRNDIVSKNGKPYVFYSINLAQKNSEGKKDYFKKEVYFKTGVELNDKTKIKVLNMYERARENGKDKYHPIWGIFINEFEVIEEPNYFEEEDKIEGWQGLSDDDSEIIDPNW